jgi:ABC-2 type transport system ATP-binding protein
MPESAVVTEWLMKRFGSFRAVDDLNLEVKTGNAFGLLGPDGADNQQFGTTIFTP